MVRRGAPAGAAPVARGGALPAPVSDEGAFARFIREEIMAPERRAANWSMVTALSLFAGSIVAVRTWGELMLTE